MILPTFQESHMRSLRIFNLGLTMVLAFSLIGCAPVTITGRADVDKTVFGPSERFAVVSIAAVKTFEGEQGLMQTFKKNDEEPEKT